ncbi:hypothetical protein GCM10022258_12610 [Aquimarina gracilis]
MILIHFKVGYALNLFPKISDTINSTIKMKNRIFAMLAAPAAIPPNPNIPATTAKMIKMTVQRNILIGF